MVRADLDDGSCRPGLHRVEEDHLVGLQDAVPFAPRVAQQQVRRPQGQYRRAADGRDARQQRRELLARAFVPGGDLAHHPGRLGLRVPVLDPAFVICDGVAGDPHGAAARKLRGGFRGLGAPGDRRDGGAGGLGEAAGSHEAMLPRRALIVSFPTGSVAAADRAYLDFKRFAASGGPSGRRLGCCCVR